jgi:hypothetical protein
MVGIEFLGSHKRRLGSPEVERVKAQARISREIGGVVPTAHQVVREPLHRIGHAAELERRSRQLFPGIRQFGTGVCPSTRRGAEPPPLASCRQHLAEHPQQPVVGRML